MEKRGRVVAVEAIRIVEGRIVVIRIWVAVVVAVPVVPWRRVVRVGIASVVGDLLDPLAVLVDPLIGCRRSGQRRALTGLRDLPLGVCTCLATQPARASPAVRVRTAPFLSRGRSAGRRALLVLQNRGSAGDRLDQILARSGGAQTVEVSGREAEGEVLLLDSRHDVGLADAGVEQRDDVIDGDRFRRGGGRVGGHDGHGRQDGQNERKGQGREERYPFHGESYDTPLEVNPPERPVEGQFGETLPAAGIQSSVWT